MFQRILAQIAASLEALKIPYMVIGGQAVLLYGEPRLTKDIDVTLGVGSERAEHVMRLVAEWGWRMLVEDPADFARKALVLPCIDPTNGIRVDFIFSSSAYERQAIKRARRVLQGDMPVCFASAEDVIIHKVIAGRARDWEDVRMILAKQPTLDVHYMRQWLWGFEDALPQKFWDRFEEVWTTARGPLPSTGGKAGA